MLNPIDSIFIYILIYVENIVCSAVILFHIMLQIQLQKSFYIHQFILNMNLSVKGSLLL